MKEYNASGGGSAPSTEKATKKSTGPKKSKEKVNVSTTKAGSGGSFISKEYIEDSDSDSSDDGAKKKKTERAVSIHISKQ